VKVSATPLQDKARTTGWRSIPPPGRCRERRFRVLKTDETGVRRLADRSYHNRLSSFSPDVATECTSESLKGDSRRTIEVFGIAPDGRSLFVSWASTQADLWLMELGGKR
jgi:hypothetical protein